MVKSRSRSPRWKPRPPPYRSPEHNRHRHFQEHYQDGEGFHRDHRKPIHWEEERHAQSNSRMTPYKRFHDKGYEPDSFSTDLRKSPFESSRPNREHSPHRRGGANRRFPSKYPDEHSRHSHREHRDYHHRHQEFHEQTETNGFKPTRRGDIFHRSYHRDPDRDWHEIDGQWNPGQSDHYLSPPRRRSEEFVDRSSFHKRHAEDRDYTEHEPLHKRSRDPDRHDYWSPSRHSHWNDDHSSQPYHNKDIVTNLRDPSPVVYQTHMGELTKIQYDYSHRSPSYVHAEPHFLNDRDERHNHYEDQKAFSTRASQHNRSNMSNRERGKTEHTTKYNEKKVPDKDTFKMDHKFSNHKHKESGRKTEYRREPSSKRHMDNHIPKSSDPTSVPSSNCEKESNMANVDLKKSMDKYRQPHWNISKDIQPKSEVPQGKMNRDKMSEKGGQKRSGTTSKDRQTSEDLVAVRGKDTFHPVFNHLSSTKQGGLNAPSTEFTQEIITIIHEVKANHFKSPEMTLHERFSKLQADGHKDELDVDRPTAQPNPEIHRRIDISLEDLQNKTFHKTEVTLTSQRVIEDPNDLRHDIERRRKQRLHSEEDSNANVGFCESYYKTHNNETEKFQKMSRGGGAPFRKSTGRPLGSSYKGNSNQFLPSGSHFEHADDVRKHYKEWRNPATRM